MEGYRGRMDGYCHCLLSTERSDFTTVGSNCPLPTERSDFTTVGSNCPLSILAWEIPGETPDENTLARRERGRRVRQKPRAAADALLGAKNMAPLQGASTKGRRSRLARDYSSGILPG